MGAALPIALGLQVGSSLLAAKAAQDEGKASSRYYDMLGVNADQNADLALAGGDRASREIQDQAASDAGRLRTDVRRVQGTQDATLAANGVGGGATAEDIARDTSAKARLDELAISYNADAKSAEVRRNASIESSNLRFQAAGYRVAGANANVAGRQRAMLSLVGGASQVATTAYAARR